MFRPPAIVMVASGLLLGSIGALGVSLSQYGERSVEHLVTAPGVRQGVDVAASAPRGDSRFAVYSPPAGAPPAPPQSGSTSGSSAPAAPAPAPAPKKKAHH